MSTALHGVHEMTATVYHARPELSSSGARKLLPPHTPATFHYERTHPPKPTDEMTFGSAVHTLVLGAGADIVEVEAANWLTKAAKEAKRDALAAGQIPLLTHEHDRAREMAAAVRHHPLAAGLLQTGRAEQALFWTDEETGVPCRALVDWMTVRPSRLLLVDYKTCASASLDGIEKAVYQYGYHIQRAFYLAGVRALGLSKQPPAFTFIFQEKAAPYLVNVVQLGPIAVEAGEHYARVARLTYRDCAEAGHWPGYRTDDIELVELPGYAINKFREETGR